MTIGWLIVLAVATVLVSIVCFRLHAFLALLFTSILVAALTLGTDLQRFADDQVAIGKLTAAEAATLCGQTATTRVAMALGETVGKIGIVIALASVIGGLLMQSGAASRIVNSILNRIGEKRAPEALAASSFVLGIPVFFDTVFYLMIPLARSLQRKTGKGFILYILAIMAGGSITHSLIPPTPGPIQVAALVNVDIGVMMIAGFAIGSVTSVFALLSARLIDRWAKVPYRETSGAIASSDPTKEPKESLEPEVLPPLLLALLPIIVPVVLLTSGSITSALLSAGVLEESMLTDMVRRFGDKNIALLIGTLAAFVLMPWVAADKRRVTLSAAVASAGNIILITAAGGALGRVLYQAGIGEAVGSLVSGVPGLLLLPLAFLITAAIRTVQGSATIAMITSAGILQGIAAAEALPFHPVYLAMAIGAGSKPISWMTDSAFWIISEMSGMTEREALRVISPMSIALGLIALLVTMFFAAIYPAVS